MQNIQKFEQDGYDIRRAYLNTPQMVVAVVNARITVLRWGRRTGKTARALSLKLLRNMDTMPRSTGLLCGKSYAKLLSHMLKEVIAAWEEFGLVRDEDFMVGKEPPKTWKRPLVSPEKWDYIISRPNGSIIHLMGFDHSTTANSLATDWQAYDEAKQLPYDRIQKEVLPTLSGHYLHYRDAPEHLSIIICTDGNIGKNDHDWVEQYKKGALTNDEIHEIIMLHHYLQENDENKEVLEKHLKETQAKSTLFLEASTVENLAVLGIDYFRNQAKSLEPFEFMESILNERTAKTTDMFYRLLDEETHGYESNNYSQIDAIGIESYISNQNSLADADWRPELPIKLSIDFGAHYNWFVINQKYNDTYYCLKGFYVASPLKFQDGVQQFCNYYKNHQNKVVHLYYDIQANKENTRSITTDAEEVIKILKQNGWTVINKCAKAQYIPHYIKHRIWMKVLDSKAGRDNKFPRFAINLQRAYEVFFSMSKAKTKPGVRVEIQKDKDSEKDKQLPQWQATHFSDTQDNIICYDLIDQVKNKQKFSVF